MRADLVVVGRVRGPLSDAVGEYERRAARYWKFNVVEVGAATGRNRSAERVMEEEAERILCAVGPTLDLVALTRDGKPMASTVLATYLSDAMVRASPGVAFVIGGAFGLHSTVLARATLSLSLSAMTLPHEMARLVLAEQLYRAGTILRNEPYHKGA